MFAHIFIWFVHKTAQSGLGKQGGRIYIYIYTHSPPFFFLTIPILVLPTSKLKYDNLKS